MYKYNYYVLLSAVDLVLRLQHKVNDTELVVKAYFDFLQPATQDSVAESQDVTDTDSVEVENMEMQTSPLPVDSEPSSPAGTPHSSQDVPLESEQEALLCCKEWSDFLQTLGFTSTKSPQRPSSIDVLTLKGMENDKQAAIVLFLTTPIEREALLIMEPGMLKYVQIHCHQLLADMDQVSIFPLEGEENCGLKVSVACQMAEEVLQGVVSSICTRIITVNVPGVTRFLDEKECRSILNEMETKFQVFISLKYVPWEPLPHQVTIVSIVDKRQEDGMPAPDQFDDMENLDLYTAEEPSVLTDQDSDVTDIQSPQPLSDQNVPSAFLPKGVLGSSLEEEAQLSLAIQYSMEANQWSQQDEEEQLKKALELSKKVIQEEHSNSTSGNSQQVARQQSAGLSFENALKAANTLQLHVFAGYSCDLIRVDIAFNKKVNQRQVEEKVEHRTVKNMTNYHEYSLLSHLPDATKIDEESEEFQEVVKNFYSTIQEYHSKIRIIQVEKLMNRLLYNQYKLKKASVLQHSTQPVVERVLYHGTSEGSVKEICVHGFNRSFCGKNATVYGQGVYFAVNSALSVQDQYSPPNPDGYKFIFASKVLTGDFTKGCHSMKTAPLKETGNIPLRYDSVTDDITKPTMFVIFNDTQAFPEYLITCQRIYR
uniref:Poly [ADP-ribose] polymerase n=1 Tax=Xiphophorus maculatus TaxID=8083 RepID=A0A3B5Q212_XIPMA